MILGFQFGDALVQIILVEQIFLLQEDQSLCHSFEVEFLRPMFVANALALSQPCLNVNQFPDFIRFQRNRVLAFGICGQGGEYGIAVIVVTEMLRSDELRSASGQIAKLSTAFLNRDAILLHELVRKFFKARGTVQH